MMTIDPNLRANMSLIPTFTAIQADELAHALVQSFTKNPEHTLNGVDKYEQYHALYVEQRDVQPPVKRETNDVQFQEMAAVAARQYQEIYNRLVKPPYVVGVDTTFLYDHHRARGKDVPAWDRDKEPGKEGWEAYQRRHHGTFNLADLPRAGRGWRVMDQMLGLNRYAVDTRGQFPEHKFERVPLVKMVPLSRREPHVQLRIDNAMLYDWQEHFDVGIRAKAYGLNEGPSRFAPGGPVGALKEILPHVFFTASEYWAIKALDAGIAAFYVPEHKIETSYPNEQVRHSWDNDGVIIDATSEEVFQSHSDWREALLQFNLHEIDNASVMPNLGPAFAAFLGEYGLAQVFSHLPKEQRPFGIYKNTARGPETTPRMMWAFGLWGIDRLTGTDPRSGEPKNQALRANRISLHYEDGQSWAEKAFDVGTVGALIYYGPKNTAEIQKILARGF